MKFTTPDPFMSNGIEDVIVDSFHVQPRHILDHNCEVPARFDTAIINDGTGGLIGVKGK